MTDDPHPMLMGLMRDAMATTQSRENVERAGDGTTGMQRHAYLERRAEAMSVERRAWDKWMAAEELHNPDVQRLSQQAAETLRIEADLIPT